MVVEGSDDSVDCLRSCLHQQAELADPSPMATGLAALLKSLSEADRFALARLHLTPDVVSEESPAESSRSFAPSAKER